MIAPAPGRNRITQERRLRPLVGGIVAAVLGLGVLVTGGSVLSANQAVQVLGAADRTEVPGLMSFDAEARSYAVIFLPHPLTEPAFDPVVALVCDVTLADGSTKVVRGARQTVEVTGLGGTSVGSFDAVAGPTEVACRFGDRTAPSGYFVAVAPEREGVALVGYVLVGFGLAALGAGVVAIVVGVRGRTVVTSASFASQPGQQI